MNSYWIIASLAAVALSSIACQQLAESSSPKAQDESAHKPKSALDFTMTDSDGQQVNLAEKYSGKVVLIVNVASKCGFTKQYAGLQELHQQYSSGGLAIVGFPCNQFLGQEPGSIDEIVQFCTSKFGVEFDLFDKVKVKGTGACELYKYLSSPEAPIEDTGSVKWNFEKFLIDRNGQLIKRFRSRTEPADIAADIEKLL